MQKFCAKCGGRLNKGRCPNCDKGLSKEMLKAKKKEFKKAAKKEKWQKLTLKQKFKKICLRILVIILALAVLTGAAAAALVYFDIVDIPIISKAYELFGIKNYDTDEDASEEGEASEDDTASEMEELEQEIEQATKDLESTKVDADSYFRNNSSVVSETEAKDSANIHTESEAYSNFVGRGFTDSIETCYSMDGDYYESEVISDSSSTQHPYYETTYVTANEEIWIIYEINGVVMANPASYNTQSGADVQLMISETDTVTSYDSVTNKFYETIPNESELIVKTVSRIDAQTLENLTSGEIDKL